MLFESPAHKSLGGAVHFELNQGRFKRSPSTNKGVLLEGLRALPAAFDLGSILNAPGFEENESSEALEQKALAGGYSALLFRPNTKPQALSENDIYAQKRPFKKLEVYSAGQLFDGDEIAALNEMHLAGAKTFWSDEAAASPQKHIAAMRYLQSVSPTTRACFDVLDKTLSENAVAFEGRVSCAQGLPSMPYQAESLAISRLIELYATHEQPIHLFNVCTARGVHLIKQAQQAHMNITASCQLWHLIYDDGALERSPYQLSLRHWPPLCSPEDKRALLGALDEGILFFTSGHACVAHHKREGPFVEAYAHQDRLETTLKTALSFLGDDPLVRSMERAKAAFEIANGDLVWVDNEHQTVLLTRADRVIYCSESAPDVLKKAATAT